MSIVKAFVPLALAGTLFTPLLAHADSIHDRFQDQHTRISQGVHSGELTRREQYRLGAREAHIRYQADRARLSGGRFSPAERCRIQQEQNQASRAIYRQKHDRQER